jgi:hypothetical protein
MKTLQYVGGRCDGHELNVPDDFAPDIGTYYTAMHTLFGGAAPQPIGWLAEHYQVVGEGTRPGTFRLVLIESVRQEASVCR